MSPYIVPPIETFQEPIAELPAPPSWIERNVWPLVLDVGGGFWGLIVSGLWWLM